MVHTRDDTHDSLSGTTQIYDLRDRDLDTEWSLISYI